MSAAPFPSSRATVETISLQNVQGGLNGEIAAAAVKSGSENISGMHAHEMLDRLSRVTAIVSSLPSRQVDAQSVNPASGVGATQNDRSIT